MAFNLDSIKEAISGLKARGTEYAGNAMDKTKDAARIAKLTLSLGTEKESLKKAYLELGKAYYEEHHGDAEGLYAQLVEEVDAVNKRIEEMQTEIDTLKASLKPAEDANFEEVVAQDETVEVAEEAPAEETAEAETPAEEAAPAEEEKTAEEAPTEE